MASVITPSQTSYRVVAECHLACFHFRPTHSPVTLSFGNPPPVETVAVRSGEPETGNGVLWGGAALAVIAGATAAALEAQRRRKEEEARQAAEAAKQAAQKNAAFEAERLQNYLNGKARLDAALQNSGLSEAEKQAVQAQAKSKGLGVALGLLAVAAESVRKSAQAAEQRAARKEELLDAQMKSLTAKPQEWKAAAQACLTQKALDAFRAQERSSASLPAAGQGKSPWGRVEEKLTNGLITLGQKSPIARQALLNLSNTWFHYVQPTVNAAADFIGGFTAQTIQNNLDALAMIAPMPPQVRENYHNGWESLHSGRSVWYQAGRFVGSVAGIVQGVWEMGSGVATATGGTVVSCGTVVLCFAGGGAAVVAGSAVAAHGALVTTAGIVNAIRSGQMLWSEIRSSATASNARKLERNIEKATGQTKPAGYETHHIAPSGSNYPAAQEARNILKKFNIDINDASNGVFLPKQVHNGLANDHRYMKAMLSDLRRAASRDEAIEILQKIGQKLLDGTYPRSGR